MRGGTTLRMAVYCVCVCVCLAVLMSFVCQSWFSLQEKAKASTGNQEWSFFHRQVTGNSSYTMTLQICSNSAILRDIHLFDEDQHVSQVCLWQRPFFLNVPTLIVMSWLSGSVYQNEDPQQTFHFPCFSPHSGSSSEVCRIANRGLWFMAARNDACCSIFNTTVGCLLVSQHFGILQRDMIPVHGRDGMYSPCGAQLLIFSAEQLYT